MANDTCSIELSRDSFKQMNSEERDAVIFDCLKTLTDDLKEIKKKNKLEYKKQLGTASFFGFLGGIVGSLLKPFLP